MASDEQTRTAPRTAAPSWFNPAAGTMLWRLRNFPDTMTHDEAVTMAKSLLARVDAQGDPEAAASREVPPEPPRSPLPDADAAEWHDDPAPPPELRAEPGADVVACTHCRDCACNCHDDSFTEPAP